MRQVIFTTALIAVSLSLIGCGGGRANASSSGGGYAIAINSLPSDGAVIFKYNTKQNTVKIGTTPFSGTWSEPAGSAMLITWQGREVKVIPRVKESITVDFSQTPPKVTGADVLASK